VNNIKISSVTETKVFLNSYRRQRTWVIMCIDWHFCLLSTKTWGNSTGLDGSPSIKSPLEASLINTDRRR